MRPRASLLIVATALLVAACGSPEQRAADYLVKAQSLYDAGEYTKARLEAQNAAQVEPKNAKARYLLALIAEHEEEFSQMFGHLTVAVDGDPSNVEARLKLGTLYFLGQSLDEAEKQVTALLNLAPDDARVHLLNARIMIQRGNTEAGLAEVERAMELDPDNVDGIMIRAAAASVDSVEKGLAVLDAGIERLPKDKTRPMRELRIMMLAQGKRLDEVEAALRDLARDFPEEQGYQVQLAQFYASQGRVDEADKLLLGLTEADPKDEARQLNYIQFLAGQKDTKKGEAALKTFIEKNPDAARLQLALAQLYETSDRDEEARKTYAALAARSPKTVEGLAARTRIAAIDIRANRTDEGRAAIEEILKDAPDDAGALLLRAGLRFADNRYDDTIGDLRLVLRKEPKNDRALLLLGQTYVRKNDLTLAKDTYRRLLEVAPNSLDGLQQLAVLYVAGKEFAEAEALLRKSLELKPDDVVNSGRLVEVLMAQGETANAEAEARRMASLTNQEGVGDFSLGRVMAQRQDFAGAAAEFRKSVAARPDDPLPLEGLIRSLLAAGKKAEAIEELKGQIEKPENPLFAKFLLGSIYASDGDTAQAERYLNEVVKEKPSIALAWVSLAGAYKDPAQRLDVLKRGVQAVPDHAELRMLLGSEYEKLNRIDDAIATYEEALKVSPEYEPAVNNLAALLLDYRTDKASHERALKLARQLANQENPAMLDTLGWAHYRVGEYPEAVRVLERVVAKAGEFPVFRYHLGMAYLNSGNPVGARQELRQAVDKAQGTYPGLDEARATLEKLDKAS